MPNKPTEKDPTLVWEDTELEGTWKASTEKVLFWGNSSAWNQSESSVLKYLSPIADYLKKNPKAVIIITLTSPGQPDWSLNGGPTLQRTNADRLSAIREAMEKLGVKRERVIGEQPEWGVSGN